MWWWPFRSKIRAPEVEAPERPLPEPVPADPVTDRLPMIQSTVGNQAVQRLIGERTTHPGGGQPLEPRIRPGLEVGFGHDLGGIRIHTDTEGQEKAKQHGARAVTVGSDIYFAPGRYDPASRDGQRLLAHEIAHTIQQRGGTTETQGGAGHERDADRAAAAVLTGGRAAVTPGGAPVLQRTPEETPPDPTRTAAEAMANSREKIREIETALSLGNVWSFEGYAGDQFTYPHGFGPGPMTLDQRNAFLRTLLEILRELMRRLAGGMPATWTLPDVLGIGGDDYHLSPELRPLGHLLQERGTPSVEADLIFDYMLHTRGAGSVAPRARVTPRPHALNLGVPLDARDPDRDPQNIRIHTGFDPADGVVVDLWSDEDGLYFYYWKGRRIYLPGFRWP
jgi:hypothetical protein